MQASEKKILINRLRRRIQWENAAKIPLDVAVAKSWSLSEIDRTIRILDREGVSFKMSKTQTREQRIHILRCLRTILRYLPDPAQVPTGRDPGHDGSPR